MKNIPLLLLLFFCPAFVKSQIADTAFISISQENGPMEKQQLMDQYDYVFGSLEPARWLFALNLTPPDDLIRVSVEGKIASGIGVHGFYGLDFGQIIHSADFNTSNTTTHRFGLEPRWYYDMPRRIRKGRSANNMSGNYIGLESVYSITRSNNGEEHATRIRNSFALRYGLQRRLFRYGFLDLGFGVGMQRDQWPQGGFVEVGDWKLYAHSQIGLGLALARPKTTPSKGQFCDVLHCFREERHMWKVDLYNLIRINDLDNFKCQISLGYEFKLGNSPFSIEIQAKLSNKHSYDIYSGFNSYERRDKRLSYAVQFQPRYYYAQNRRIAQGKSGNNLSGFYFAGQIQLEKTESRHQGYECGDFLPGCSPFNSRGTIQSYGGGAMWGIQHRLFQHGFIDFQAGYKLDISRDNVVSFDTGSKYVNTIVAADFIFNLRAGLAF